MYNCKYTIYHKLQNPSCLNFVDDRFIVEWINGVELYHGAFVHDSASKLTD